MSKNHLDAARLRAEVEGRLVLPGEPGWDEARQAWQLAADQYPDPADLVRGSHPVALACG